MLRFLCTRKVLTTDPKITLKMTPFLFPPYISLPLFLSGKLSPPAVPKWMRVSTQPANALWRPLEAVLTSHPWVKQVLPLKREAEARRNTIWSQNGTPIFKKERESKQLRSKESLSLKPYVCQCYARLPSFMNCFDFCSCILSISSTPPPPPLPCMRSDRPLR